MKLSQANKYFNTVSLAGWNGSTWVADVIAGNFLTFDRFISARTFGQRKRMLEVGGPAELPSQYTALKTPDGAIFLVDSENADIRFNEVYGRTYLLHEAPYLATVISFVTTPSASGIGGSVTESASAALFCDYERVTSERNSEFDGVRFSSHVIWLPGGTVVTTDNKIAIDGTRYDISEVNTLLGLVEVRALKQGGGV